METIGRRIAALRNLKGWSRPELGSRMAAAVGREKPFSGEVIRLSEEDLNAPGVDARRALAKVFDRSEIYIQFGATAVSNTPQHEVSTAALEIARAFDQLSTVCQDHVRAQIELLSGTAANTDGRRRAAKHDTRIRDGRIENETTVRKRTIRQK